MRFAGPVWPAPGRELQPSLRTVNAGGFSTLNRGGGRCLPNLCARLVLLAKENRSVVPMGALMVFRERHTGFLQPNEDVRAITFSRHSTSVKSHSLAALCSESVSLVRATATLACRPGIPNFKSEISNSEKRIG